MVETMTGERLLAAGQYERANRFFDSVLAYLGAAPSVFRIAVVTHLLPDRPALLRALSRLGRIEWVMSIPYSERPGISERVEALGVSVMRAPTDVSWPPNESWFEEVLERTLELSSVPLVLCEIGGYFASAVSRSAEGGTQRLLGVVEDTESGHALYLGVTPLLAPVFSVARSPLKAPEDTRVGESIAFSVERLLRGLDRSLRGAMATVLGFGKIGRATATALHSRGATVAVWDPDGARRALALSLGHLSPSRTAAIRGADLIVGTSGSASLTVTDLGLFKSGCLLASGSSRQVEFEPGLVANTKPLRLRDLPSDLDAIPLPGGGAAFLACRGQPVNFSDAASVGPYLQLLQAEMLAAVRRLPDATSPGLQELEATDRDHIAWLWIEAYVNEDSGTLLQDGMSLAKMRDPGG